jgi:microcystin-dependent protein
LADTTTPKYGWVQPAVGGDASTWGTTINNDLALIDAQVWSNEQGVAPVGTVVMFAGPTAPANWFLCQGQSLSTTTYAALFNVIGYNFGGSGANFLLPNFVSRFPEGATAQGGGTGGAATATLAIANLPSHNHAVTIGDPSHYHTAVNDPGHTHGVSQSPHAHPDPGHTHGASAGDSGTHVHGSSLMRFVGSGGTYGINLGPNVNIGNTDPSNAPGVNVVVNSAYTGQQAQNANVSIAVAGTGITNTSAAVTGVTATTAAVGSATPISILPPFLNINFIIRYA